MKLRLMFITIIVLVSCFIPFVSNAIQQRYSLNIPKDIKIPVYEKGIASWYGPNFHGNLTANGEIYDMYKITAAHKSLPFGTLVKVKNLENDKTLIVRINDRGPFIDGRIIDLSYKAAQLLDIGIAKVNIAIVGYEINSKVVLISPQIN